MDFEQVYTDQFLPVYRYILSLCRDPVVAEEVTQETFYRAMESFHHFRGDSSVFVWLCQIGKNTLTRRARRQKRFIPLDESRRPIIDNSMEEAFSDREDARRLEALMQELDEPYREVFSLRTFGELPYVQIGALYGKTDGWARVIYFRAKTELRRKYDGSDL